MRQLGAVDASALSGGDIEIEDVRKKLAPDFVTTFKSLSRTMVAQETKLQAKEGRRTSQLSSQTLSSNSQNLLDTISPSDTVSTADLLSEPKTPDQLTHPRDPQWSGSSTASKDEEATKKLLFNMLSDTMTILESDFRKILWQKSRLRVELAQTYS